MKTAKLLLGTFSVGIVMTSLIAAGSQQLFSLNITTLNTQGALAETQTSSDSQNLQPQSSASPSPTPTKNSASSPEVKPANEQAQKELVSVKKIPDGKPLNILVIGSDTREGDTNSKYGNPEEITGARSDSTILININNTRETATVISIPRDLIVDIPECTDPINQKTIRARNARFNEAYALGGPGCAIKTTSQLFKELPIHHVVVVDFSGFAEIIDTIGGLDICLNEPMKDKKSKLNLPAGKQTINGEQALALARARYSIGDGSDISRIDRQQAILKQILVQIKNQNIQSNPIALYAITQNLLSSLAVDENLSEPASFANLAFTGLGIDDSNITYETVPWLPRGDNATLLVDNQKIGMLIDKITEEEIETPTPNPTISPNFNKTQEETISSKKKEKPAKKNTQTLCDNPLF